MSSWECIFLYQGLHSVRSRKMEQNIFSWTLRLSELNLIPELGKERVRRSGHLSGIEVTPHARGSFWQWVGWELRIKRQLGRSDRSHPHGAQAQYVWERVSSNRDFWWSADQMELCFEAHSPGPSQLFKCSELSRWILTTYSSICNACPDHCPTGLRHCQSPPRWKGRAAFFLLLVDSLPPYYIRLGCLKPPWTN